MLLSVFEKYIFLQSLGWGIANSLWQAALLWAFYQLVTVNSKKTAALFKYHFSLILLLACFAWFVSTVVQNYIVIKQSGAAANAFGWLSVSKNITDSLQWVSVAYFIVLAVHIFQFAKKLKGIFVLKNNDLAKAPIDIRLFTEQTAFHIGIKKKVSIWISQKANVPSVIGFFKPVILLPVTALNHLTTEQAEAVILHELAHIKRNDYILNFIQCIIEMLLFFNPFAKLLGNSIRKERENCCDDWVMNYQYNKNAYASALLVLEQNRTASIAFALAATSGKKMLLARVKRLFAAEPKTSFTFFQKVQLLSIVFVVLFMVLLAFPVVNKVDEKGKKETVGIVTPFVIPVAYTYNETNEQPVAKRPGKKMAKRKIEKTIKTNIDEQASVEEIESNTALVNEELLNNDKKMQLQQIAIQAANKELQTTQKIIVTIEEEESGKKDKNTYLIEVNNNNGNPEVKPLIILNKKMKAVEKLKAKNKLRKINPSMVTKKRVST